MREQKKCGKVNVCCRPVFLVFCFSVIVVVPLLNAQTTQPAGSKRPTLDEILADDEPSSEQLRFPPVTSMRNPFFQVDSVAAKFGIFLGLALMIYCIIVVGFNNALERGRPPLPAFFRFNTIFLLSILFLD
jgi:hypothetical protein